MNTFTMNQHVEEIPQTEPNYKYYYRIEYWDGSTVDEYSSIRLEAADLHHKYSLSDGSIAAIEVYSGWGEFITSYCW